MDDSGSPEDATGQSAEPGLNLGGTPPSYPPPSFPPPYPHHRRLGPARQEQQRRRGSRST